MIRCAKLFPGRFTRYAVTLISLIGLCLGNPAQAFSPYSTRELEELEQEFRQLINQSDQVVRTPLANQYLNHLGKRLAQFAHMPMPYFFIVKSNEINAFAGPGGYIGINTQLVLATKNESELAAVMAHEIAHVRLHHLYRMIQHQKQMRVPMLASMLAAVALGAINPTLASGAMIASLTGFAQDNINFTRANEKEADRIGITMLIKGGFDPRGMAGFFKKMQESTRYYYTDNIPAILRTHPLDEDRIAEAENRSGNINRKNYPDTLDYYLFKELIRNSVAKDNKQMLDYYGQECLRHNRAAACQYGKTLALIKANQFRAAEQNLAPLTGENKDNLFYQVAMAEAETGNRQFDVALKRLHELQANYPENYAALMAYAQGLLEAGQAEKATALLLKGFRQFKRDLPLCEALAQAEAASGLKGYAYFVQAQCNLLQGRSRDALRQLNVAKKLAGNDRYLAARILALKDDIQFMVEKQ